MVPYLLLRGLVRQRIDQPVYISHHNSFGYSVPFTANIDLIHSFRLVLMRFAAL